MSDALTRPFRLALLASLLLNAALAGVLGALWLRSAGDTGDVASSERSEDARTPSPGRLGRELAPEQRALMRETFARHRAPMREHAEAARAARRAVAAVLRSEPYDRDALAAAFAELRARDGEAAAVTHAMLLDLADRLDAEGRERLAARIERAGRHHRGGRGATPKK
ncbi:periplasmic heavy metal sensor [Rehaibacterium terrae]|jgi:uncharacterized membrane protein|uniref:Signaling pathway modulator ZraP n=1 Tax=Rehaibacterium terrae TaxID=1341696 RepID=A0A7W7V7L1_9GAMM|nr:periplasmic heavy metal sensor [Rehaibacterium terrae]MBB5014681.1 putative membrane protein [Rehaibacterium terrae]